MTKRVKMYGFRKGEALVQEGDGSYTFFRTFDEAEANKGKDENIAHISVNVKLFKGAK